MAVVATIVAGLLVSPGSGGGTGAAADVLPYAAGVTATSTAGTPKNSTTDPSTAATSAAPSDVDPAASTGVTVVPVSPGYGGDEPSGIVTVPDLPPGAIEPLATLSVEAPAGPVATTAAGSPRSAPARTSTASTRPVSPVSSVSPVQPTSRPTAPPTRTTPAASTTTAAPGAPGAPSRAITVLAHYAHPLGWVGGGKVVSLTFDDGPSQYTGPVLDVLARYGVKATFCQIGEQVGDFPAVEKRIAAQGHTLCNHTWNHDEALPSRTVPVIDAEITRTQQAIHALTGTTPRYYRAPGGNWGRTGVLKAELAKYRTIPLAWADDSLDWTTPGVPTIVKNVTSTVTPGAIILMHDGGGNRSQTLAALPRIITALRAAGYTFVVLPRSPPLG